MAKKIISGIYQIRNKINGKCYVGRSVNIKGRWATHKRKLNTNKHINCKLQNSWNKYGEDSFEFSIIEECIPAESHQILREEFWRKNGDDTFNLGLSEHGGAFTLKGHPRENEIRQKLREASTGKKASDETKLKMSLSHKGHKKSKEWKQKLKNSQPIEKHRENTKRLFQNEAFRRKHSEKLKGINNCQIMRKVSINEIEYESISEAARQLNIKRDCVRARLNSRSKKFENYKFI